MCTARVPAAPVPGSLRAPVSAVHRAFLDFTVDGFESRTDKSLKTALGHPAWRARRTRSVQALAPAVLISYVFSPRPALSTGVREAEVSLRLSGRSPHDAATSARKTRGVRMSPTPSPTDA